jgi:hypothetical protein
MVRSHNKRLNLTPEQKALAEQEWPEIGRSIAIAVVHGGKTITWAWEILMPLGIYEYWMLVYWVKKCRRKCKPTRLARGRPRAVTSVSRRSVFKSQEDIKLAMRMLTDGIDPQEVIDTYNKKREE